MSFVGTRFSVSGSDSDTAVMSFRTRLNLPSSINQVAKPPLHETLAAHSKGFWWLKKLAATGVANKRWAPYRRDQLAVQCAPHCLEKSEPSKIRRNSLSPDLKSVALKIWRALQNPVFLLFSNIRAPIPFLDFKGGRENIVSDGVRAPLSLLTDIDVDATLS